MASPARVLFLAPYPDGLVRRRDKSGAKAVRVRLQRPLWLMERLESIGRCQEVGEAVRNEAVGSSSPPCVLGCAVVVRPTASYQGRPQCCIAQFAWPNESHLYVCNVLFQELSHLGSKKDNCFGFILVSLGMRGHYKSLRYASSCNQCRCMLKQF